MVESVVAQEVQEEQELLVWGAVQEEAGGVIEKDRWFGVLFEVDGELMVESEAVLHYFGQLATVRVRVYFFDGRQTDIGEDLSEFEQHSIFLRQCMFNRERHEPMSETTTEPTADIVEIQRIVDCDIIAFQKSWDFAIGRKVEDGGKSFDVDHVELEQFLYVLDSQTGQIEVLRYLLVRALQHLDSFV
jgi:hypothetical protein